MIPLCLDLRISLSFCLCLYRSLCMCLFLYITICDQLIGSVAMGHPRD